MIVGNSPIHLELSYSENVEKEDVNSKSIKDRIARLVQQRSNEQMSHNIEPYKAGLNERTQNLKGFFQQQMQSLAAEAEKAFQKQLETLNSFKKVLKKTTLSLKLEESEIEAIREDQKTITMTIQELDHLFLMLAQLHCQKREQLDQMTEQHKELTETLSILEQELLLIKNIQVELETTFVHLQTEIMTYKQEQTKLKKEIERLKEDVRGHEQKIYSMSNQVIHLNQENTQIALAAQKMSESFNNIQNQLNDIERQIIELKEERQKWFGLFQTAGLIACAAMIFAGYALFSPVSGVAAGGIEVAGIEIKIGLLGGSGALLLSQTASEKKKKTDQESKQSEAHLHQFGTSNPFSPIIQANSRFIYKTMLPVHHLAEAHRIALYPVEKTIEYATKGVAALCQSHPNMQRTCHSMVNDVLRPCVSYVSGMVPQAVQDRLSQISTVFGKNIDLIAKVNEENFNIPPEKTRQYFSDVATLGIAMVPILKGLRVRKATPIPINLAPLTSQSTSLPPITTNQNISQPALNFKKAIDSEKMLVNQVIEHLPAFQLPKDFPRNTNQFFSQCKAFCLKGSKLGEDKKGKMTGHVVYKQMDDNSVVFLIQYRTNSLLVKKNIGHYGKLIHSENLIWSERLEFILEEAFHFAKTNESQRMFLAWDPKFHPLASVVFKRPGLVIGANKISNGVGQTPLQTIEIMLPK